MKIFVGNLSFSATEDTLRDAFAEYGDVDDVVIVSDRETGRSRGFAFVTMHDQAQAEAAIRALDGKDLEGRPVKVSEARPKAPGGPGGGGPRGRGGPGGGGGGGGHRGRY